MHVLKAYQPSWHGMAWHGLVDLSCAVLCLLANSTHSLAENLPIIPLTLLPFPLPDVGTVLPALSAQRACRAVCMSRLPEEDGAADGDSQEGVGRLRSALHQRECRPLRSLSCSDSIYKHVL